MKILMYTNKSIVAIKMIKIYGLTWKGIYDIVR